MSHAPENVTAMLIQWGEGDQDALDRVIPIVYDELHRIAERYFRRERLDNTLQPTALVNEVYLRLIKQSVGWQNRAHFYGIAANTMRRILVERARARRVKTWKRPIQTGPNQHKRCARGDPDSGFPCP